MVYLLTYIPNRMAVFVGYTVAKGWFRRRARENSPEHLISFGIIGEVPYEPPYRLK
jgi:hypothetical protein